MKIRIQLAIAGLFTLSGAPVLRAQAPVTPCKESACFITVDWGSGKTSGSFPPDRRYGSGDDFDSRFRTVMSTRGFRLRDTPGDGAWMLTVRPTMRPKSMCDAMPGINTDMSCTAMSAVTMSFTSGDPAVKAPGTVRVNNRCGAGDTFVDHKIFAQYAADMVWYELEGKFAKADKPIVHC